MQDSIFGVEVVNVREIKDERGSILHVIREDDQLFEHFGECYCSEILPGYVKAWKFHHRQKQNLVVPVGRVKFVLYDNRPDSGSNGSLMEVQLGRPDAYHRLTIPAQIWYGFTCLSSEPALLVNCATEMHDPSESKILAPEDELVPYKW